MERAKEFLGMELNGFGINGWSTARESFGAALEQTEGSALEHLCSLLSLLCFCVKK